MGILAQALQGQEPQTEQKKSPFAQALEQVQPAAPVIQEKVQSGQSLSRTDLYNLGVDERTSAKERKVISDALRRKQSPFVAGGMGFSPLATKEEAVKIGQENLETGKALTSRLGKQFYNQAVAQPVQAMGTQSSDSVALAALEQDVKKRYEAGEPLTKQEIEQYSKPYKKGSLGALLGVKKPEWQQKLAEDYKQGKVKVQGPKSREQEIADMKDLVQKANLTQAQQVSIAATVKEASNLAEKAVDVIGGIGGFVVQLAALKRFIPGAPEIFYWELQNQAIGGTPGKGALSYEVFAAPNKLIPGQSVVSKAGRVAGSAATLGGMSAVEQKLATGKINWTDVAMQAGIGTYFGVKGEMARAKALGIATKGLTEKAVREKVVRKEAELAQQPNKVKMPGELTLEELQTMRRANEGLIGRRKPPPIEAEKPPVRPVEPRTGETSTEAPKTGFAAMDATARGIQDRMRASPNADAQAKGTPYEASEYKVAVEKLVGERNWEMAKAQSDYDRRSKEFSSKSLDAVTLNIQYRERPEILAELEASAPKKYKAAIEKSKNLNPREQELVRELEAGFAADLARAQEAGVIESAQEHYINQVWDLSKKGKNAASAKAFGQRMAESQQRHILGGYLEGIKLGLKPITLNAAKLRRLYQDNLAKAIHEKEFLDTLRNMRNENGEPILTKIGADTDWNKYTVIDHPALRHYRFMGTATNDGPLQGLFGTDRTITRTSFLERSPLAVHREAAPKLRALLDKSLIRQTPILRQALTFGATSKYMTLSFSGFHHTALAKTAIFYGANPLPFGRRSYISGLDLIANNDPIVKLLVEKGGMTLGQSSRMSYIKDVASAPFEYLGEKAGLPGRAIAHAKRWWDQSLWDHYFVGLKAMSGKLWYDKVRAMYPEMSEVEVARTVGNDLNNNFGGLNWELLGASQTHLDMMRLLLLAPDWTLSNWRFFGDAAKVTDGYRLVRNRIKSGELSVPEQLFIGDTKTAPATRYMGRVIATLGTAVAAANIALWGTPLPQDEQDKKSKWYMIKLPYKTPTGGYYYLDIMGHFFEPIRAVSDPVRWAKGKRSVTWKTIEEAVTGRNWRGEYIKSVSELYEGMKEGEYSLYKSQYDAESTGWGSIPTRVIHSVSSFVPIPVQTAVDVGTGEKDAVEVASVLGATVRRGQKPQTERKTRKLRGTRK